MKKITVCLFTGLIMIVCVAYVFSAEPPVKKVFPEPGSSLYYPGVLVGKTYYISGTGAALPGGGFPETYEERARQTIENIRGTLKLAGLDLENVVQAWVYLDDSDKIEAVKNYESLKKIFAEYFPQNPPACTVNWVGRIPGDNHSEMTVIACSDLSERRVIGTPTKDMPYSPGVLVGNTLYISGQLDQLPDGSRPATFEDQVRQSMKNIGSVLKQAGLDFRHVVFSNVYANNYENRGIVNKVFSEFFEYGNTPARATVFVDRIPFNSNIQITCIATTDLSSRKAVRPESMKYGPEELSMTASPGVWAGDTLYLSAQSGYVPGEGIVTVDLEKQFHQMMKNHIDVLEEAGLGLKDVVSGNVYLRNINDSQQFNKLYGEYFASKVYSVRTRLQHNLGYERNNVRVRTSFIAARTKN